MLLQASRLLGAPQGPGGEDLVDGLLGKVSFLLRSLRRQRQHVEKSTAGMRWWHGELGALLWCCSEPALLS